MKAVCWTDYEKRVAAVAEAKAEKGRRERELEKLLEKQKRFDKADEEYSFKAKKGYSPVDLSAEIEAKKAWVNEVKIPEIGYNDFYGVWFSGKLEGIIKAASLEQFGEDIGNKMHVFVDADPKKIINGVHGIEVYGHPCRLYRWIAQKFNRGLIVLADDEDAKHNAGVYLESGTWSWQLPEEFKSKLKGA